MQGTHGPCDGKTEIIELACEIDDDGQRLTGVLFGLVLVLVVLGSLLVGKFNVVTLLG
jgi:hypothetical protein